MKQIILSVLMAWCVASPGFSQHKDSIRLFWEACDYTEVLRLTDGMSAEDGEMMDWRLQACRATSDWKEAERVLRRRLATDSLRVRTWAELAECYRRQGRLECSAEAFRRAVVLRPRAGFLRTGYVQCLLDLSEAQKAKTACHDWLAADSTSATAYRMLGQAYEMEDSIPYAFLGYNAAYRLDSLDAQTVARIANIFNLNQQYADAENITATYRCTDTLNLDVNRQHAKALCLQQKYPEAIARYEALKRMGDRSFLTCYYLGMAYYGDNWFYGAYDNLKLASKRNPTDINTLYYLGLSAARTSWKEEGVACLEQALKLAIPSDSLIAKLYDGLGECKGRAGDVPGKVAALKKSYSYSHQNKTLFSIARLYDSLKDTKNAVLYYERFMKQVPDDERYLLDENGEVDAKGMTHWQEAYRRVRQLKEQLFFEGESDGHKRQ